MPAPGVHALSNRLVTGGYAADGRPSGSLYYWSHTRFHRGFTFDLHPHQGFEIVTAVLGGGSSHFDTVTDQWNDLAPGDVQIIRSGAGIAHRERALDGTRVFQIWLDPDMEAALQRPASYTDHPAASMPTRRQDGAAVTDIAGGLGPLRAETEGLVMQRVALEPDAPVSLDLGPDRFTVAFTVEGLVTVNGVEIPADDAALAVGVPSLELRSVGPSDVFIISVPETPSHPLLRDR